MDDAELLRRAVALAHANVQSNGGPFGALVVVEGRIIAEGVNRVTADTDPTAHAEVRAIRAACSALGHHALEGAVLYTSCEPCPMCLAAAHWARVARVVFAADRHAAAAAGFDDALLHEELARPVHQRRLRVHRVHVETAHRPFEAWRLLASRTHY